MVSLEKVGAGKGGGRDDMAPHRQLQAPHRQTVTRVVTQAMQRRL